jgi:hypothetical protein
MGSEKSDNAVSFRYPDKNEPLIFSEKPTGPKKLI